MLIAPAAHPLAESTSTALDRALDHDFVTLARTASLTRKVSAAAEAAGRILRIRVQVRSFDAMSRMVAAGLGLAILPRAGAALYADALKLRIVNLEGLDVRRRLVVAMRSRAALSPAAHAFVEMIEAHAATTTPRSA